MQVGYRLLVGEHDMTQGFWMTGPSVSKLTGKDGRVDDDALLSQSKFAIAYSSTVFGRCLTSATHPPSYWYLPTRVYVKGYVMLLTRLTRR